MRFKNLKNKFLNPIFVIITLALLSACGQQSGELKKKDFAALIDSLIFKPPTDIVLLNPTKSRASDDTPTFLVTGLSQGDTVFLYSESSCTLKVGETISNGPTATITTDTLPLGDYRFFSKRYSFDGEEESECSDVFIDYSYTIPGPNSLVQTNPATQKGTLATPQFTADGLTIGDTVTLYSDANCANSVATVVAGSTSESLTSAAMPLGVYKYAVQRTDSLGNVSECIEAALTYTHTITAPSGVALSLPISSPNTDPTPEIEVSGVNIGEVVKIYSDSNCTQYEGEGTAFNTLIYITTNTLNPGSYSFYATRTDTQGNESLCTTAFATYVYNLSPITSITLVAPSNDIDTVSTPTFEVSPIAIGDTVNLYTDAGCTSLVASQVATGSTINITTNPLALGSYNFFAERVDAQGNTSGCSTATDGYTYTIVPPTTLAVTTPATQPSPTQRPTIAVSGNVQNGDTVTVYRDSSCTLSVGTGTAPATPVGPATISFQTDNLAEGTTTFYANRTDAGGNTSNCSASLGTYLRTITAPTSITMSDPLVNNSDDPTPTFNVSGGVANGNIVRLYRDSACTILVGSGTSTGTSIAINVGTPLSLGSYSFYATREDTVKGLVSLCSTASQAYTYALRTPDNLSLVSPATSPATDSTPEIQVQNVKSGNTVKLYTDNFCSDANEVASSLSSGTTINLTTNALLPGSYNLYAKSFDPSNNSSACSSQNLGTGTVAYTYVLPEPTNVTLTDPLTSPSTDSTPSFLVDGLVSGDTAEIYSDSSCTAGNLLGSAASSGTSVTVTINPLSLGTYSIYAKRVDSLGNNSACYDASLSYTYTISPPGTVVLSSPATSPNTDSTPTITISGIAPSDEITIYSDNTCNPGNLLTSATAVTATLNMTIPALALGAHEFYFRREDSSGNISNCSTTALNYVFTITAPSVITKVSPLTSKDTDDQPVINAAGIDNGDLVKIFSDSTCTTEVGSGTSVGTDIDITTNPLTLGSYTFYANRTDGVNVSKCSTANVSYIYTLTAPTTLALTAPLSTPDVDSTPTITVSGVANTDIVSLYSDVNCLNFVGDATATGSTVDVTVASPLAFGAFTFYATREDTLGNVSNCSTANVAYTHTITAPSGLTLITPAINPGLSDSPTIEVAGVAESNTVEIFTQSDCSGGAVGSGTVAASQTAVTIGLDAPLALGTYTYYARRNDGVNTSNCSTASLSYTYTIAAPTAVTLITPASSPNTDNQPVFQVDGVQNLDTVTLYSDSSCSNAIGSGASAGASVNVTANPLASFGSYTVYTNRVDSGGNISLCSTANASYVYTIDAPTSLSLFSPGTSPNTDDTPTITVSGVANGDTVNLYTDSSCTTQVGTNTASAGVVLVNASTALSLGSHDFYARRIDSSGNISNCSTATTSYVYTINEVTNIELVSPASSPSTVDTPTLRFSGLTNGDLVEVFTNASCSSATVATGGATGATLDLALNPLALGSYTFYARRTNTGHVSNCSTVSLNYTYTITAPTAVNLTTPASSPNTNDQPTFTILGVTNTDTVRLFSDSSCSTQIGSGTSAGTSISIQSSALSLGAHTIYANRTNSGHTSNCSTVFANYTYTILAPTSLALSSPATSPNTDDTPTISVGGVQLSDFVEVFTTANCSGIAIGTATAAGTSVDVTVASLALDTYDFYARRTDTSGNISLCSTATVEYIYTINEVTGITLATPASSPGTVDQPTFSVTGVTTGDVVTLYSDVSCTAAIGNNTSTGTTVSVTTNALTLGSYTVYARRVDTSGNTSNCSTVSGSYVYTITAPTALTLTSPASSPSTVDTPTINVAGADVGDTVTLYSDSSCSTLVGTEATIIATPVDIVSSALALGTHAFHARREDGSGNISNCSTASLSYTFTITAPSSITLSDPATTPNTDSTPTFTIGGVASGDTITLYNDAACTTSIGSGVSSGVTVDVATTTLATYGNVDVYARRTDSSGNISNCSTATDSYVYTIDAPTSITLTNPAATPGDEDTPTFLISGVASGDTVKIYSDSSCTTEIGSALSLDVTVSITTIALVFDSYTIYSDRLDSSGNQSLCSTASAPYTYTLSGPSVTLTSPASAQDTVATPTVTVSSTAMNSGDTINLYTDAACTTLLTSDTSTGTSHPITTPALSIGEHTIYAQFVDGSSNVSLCSSAPANYEYKIDAPTSITRSNPTGAIGSDSTPTLLVDGLQIGDTVTLFTDPTCNGFDSGIKTGVTGTSTTVDSKILTLGSHDFYAIREDSSGNVSLCSTATVSYTFTLASPTISLNTPASSPGTETSPTFTFGNIANGDLVKVFDDSGCTNQIDSFTATGVSQNFTLTTPLKQGEYDFYATRENGGHTSLCSSGLAYNANFSLTQLSQYGGHDYKDIAFEGTNAYVIDSEGFLRIFDITTPASPTLTASLAITGTIQDLKVNSGYVYLSKGTSGLDIIDATTPATPSLLFNYTISGTNVYSVAFSGNYAYLAEVNGKVSVLDITTPSAPTLEATVTADVGSPIDIVVDGNRLYIADQSNGVVGYDISTPDAPVHEDSFFLSGARYLTYINGHVHLRQTNGHIKAIDVTTTPGTYSDVSPVTPRVISNGGSYTGINSATISGSDVIIVSSTAGIDIFDVTTPSTYVAPATIQSPSVNNGNFNTIVSGNNLFAAFGLMGMSIYDISTISSPSLTTNFDITFYLKDVIVDGTTAYLLDYNKVHILDITTPATPSLIGEITGFQETSQFLLNGTTLFVADKTGGVKNFDVSTPSAPIAITTVAPTTSSISLVNDGATLFVGDTSGAIDATDFTTPGTPSSLGSFAGVSNPQYLVLNGTDLFVKDGFDLIVADVTNPAAMVAQGGSTNIGSCAGMDYNNNFLYISCNANVRVFDVTNPASPVDTANVSLGAGNYKDVFYTENFLFTVKGTSGIMVVNVDDPAAPMNAGSLSNGLDYAKVKANATHIFAIDAEEGFVIFSY